MNKNFSIENLGPAKIKSPINLGTEPGDLLADFTDNDSRILLDVDAKKVMSYLNKGEEPPCFEQAGPRQYIYFDPSKLKAAIVTCGGICPGLNNVIRGLVMTLYHGYGVKTIYGFRNGYAGLNPEFGYSAEELTPKSVKNIHSMGGTVLGTSRGAQDPVTMVDTLERMNVRLLFTVGGDGTFRGAIALCKEIKKRKLKIAVIGVPKTIDNDIQLVDKTFGFETSVGLAATAINAAYSEAMSVENGIGLIKLMGRHSGFIAASAALAMRNVNLVLIPELKFDLDGEHGLIAYLNKRFDAHKSTVIVVAEGAGQRFLKQRKNTDASGNKKLGDIGIFLKDAIAQRFGGKRSYTLKYIDPSYIIRSASACSSDSIFCGYLAQAAVHAGISGRTAMAVGRSHGKFTHLPLEKLVDGRKTVNPEGRLWLSVLESTGQPFYMTDKPPKDLSRKSFYPLI